MKNFVFCQNDKYGTAAYDTYALDHTTKYGFVSFCIPFDFVSHVSFDELDDIVALMQDGCDDMYGDLLNVAVGESINIGDVIWLRLW